MRHPLSFLTATLGSVGERLAAERVAIEGALLVVAKSRLVVGEENLADQLPPAADARLLEHLLEVLLDRVRGDHEALGYLCRGVPRRTSRVTSCSRSLSP